MSHLLKMTIVAAAFASLPCFAYGLGADQPKEEIARRANCVAGYFVNWEDVFFYAGDTAALNKFLDAYGRMKGSTLKVVLHVGPQKARSPWGTPKQDIDVDWTYYVWNGRDETVNPVAEAPPGKPAPSRVDIWLGRSIKLADLKIPENIAVESAGEIEKFIEQRKKPAEAAPKPDEKPAAPAPKAEEKKSQGVRTEGQAKVAKRDDKRGGYFITVTDPKKVEASDAK